MRWRRVTVVQVLLLSGTCGAGKSTVAAEINDILAELAVPNAALDLDALAWQWPSTSTWNDDLMFENLAAVGPTSRLEGSSTSFLLAWLKRDPTCLVTGRRFRAPASPSAGWFHPSRCG